jgi:hypothetical protein
MSVSSTNQSNQSKTVTIGEITFVSLINKCHEVDTVHIPIAIRPAIAYGIGAA